jgi:hypothetical protein
MITLHHPPRPSALAAEAHRLRLSGRAGAGVTLGIAALIGGGAALNTPAANADPYGSCGYGAPSISSPWGGFCDVPAIATGQHWHCEWGLGFSRCGWKWADNTDAPTP